MCFKMCIKLVWFSFFSYGRGRVVSFWDLVGGIVDDLFNDEDFGLKLFILVFGIWVVYVIFFFVFFMVVMCIVSCNGFINL